MKYKSVHGLLTIIAVAGLILVSQVPVSTASAVGGPLQAPTITHSVYVPIVANVYPPQTIFGAEMSATSAGGLTKMTQAGTSWVRRNGLLWSSVEPTQGTRNWGAVSYLETEMSNINSRGMKMILIVRSTPTWAQKYSGSFCGPVAQASFQAFGQFMYDVVKRYSLPPYNVHYWELFNEPDVGWSVDSSNPQAYGGWGDWGDTSYFGGAYYGEMLKVVYPYIKQADPNAKVLVGGLLLDCDPTSGGGCEQYGSLAYPPRFLEGILLDGAGSYFDGVSFHAYDYYGNETVHVADQYVNKGWQSRWNTTGPVLTKKAAFIRNLLTTYGAGSKLLLNTESAILYSPTENDQTKAAYLTQAYVAAMEVDLTANIWYTVYGWGDRLTALLNSSTQAPYPAYYSFAFARKELEGAKYIWKDTSAFPGVWVYVFRRNHQDVWVMWSITGSSQSVTLSELPAGKWVWNSTGNNYQSDTPALTFSVGFTPVYLEFTR